MGFVRRRVLGSILGVVARPRLTLVISAAVLVACVLVAMRWLTTSTDQNQLFSSDVPFFRDYLTFIHKFPENEAIYILIEPYGREPMPPVKRWTELADRIARRLRQMPQAVVSVEERIPLNQLGAQGILFDDPEQLKQTMQKARGFVPLVKLWGEEPNTITRLLGATPIERLFTAMAAGKLDEQTAGFVNLLAGSLVQTLAEPDQPLQPGKQVPDLASEGASDPSRLGYFYTTDETDPSRHLMLIRVYPREDYRSLASRYHVVEQIRDASRQEAAAFPEFRVVVTGRPAIDADEMQSTARDSHRAEVVALAVIFAGLVIMFRSIWMAVVAELTLAVAIGWTFGWATVSIGELNLLSIVFMIALIGIGMDYLIQILMAYRRESKRYVRASAIWARVFRYVGPPVTTACYGAAGAFLVSIFTDFRGAKDLGIIAGGGLLLCLLAGHTVLPAMLTLFPARIKQVQPSKRYGWHRLPDRIGGWRLVLPLLWLVLIAISIPYIRRTHFDPNMLDLQAPNLESVQQIRKLQTWSAVVLSKDLELLRKVRAAVHGASTVARTESILDAYDNYERLHGGELPTVNWAPQPEVTVEDIPSLQAKVSSLARALQKQVPSATSAIAHLRRLAELLRPSKQVAARLTQWQRGFTEQLRHMMSQLNPPPLDLSKVPAELRNRYVSKDGTFALYIYPKHDLWERPAMAAFVKQVDARVSQVPGAPAPTGIAPQVFYSTSAVESSFYRATIYAVALIFVLVLIDLRSLGQTLGAMSVLAFGLPMLLASMGLLGVSWNFANFFALPILIGAAHEYGVFMMHRYREALHDPRRVWRAWDTSDRALLLCAFVTSSSFGFFWALGHHEGLKSLGLVMAVGSGCTYLATILVLRPLLIWRLERLRRKQQDK